jgi:hypothetical protein
VLHVGEAGRKFHIGGTDRKSKSKFKVKNVDNVSDIFNSVKFIL